MTKILIDYENRDVINNLQSALSEVGKASNVSLGIPSDFGYASRVRNHLSDINSIKKNIDKLKIWYQDSQRDYEVLESELSRTYTSIEDIKVVKKESLIK